VKVRLENDWPVNSTRFLLPVVAVRGFRAGPRTVTLAWWTWRIVVHLHNHRMSDQLQNAESAP
jgi:hypothetical protein